MSGFQQSKGCFFYSQELSHKLAKIFDPLGITERKKQTNKKLLTFCQIKGLEMFRWTHVTVIAHDQRSLCSKLFCSQRKKIPLFYNPIAVQSLKLATTWIIVCIYILLLTHAAFHNSIWCKWLHSVSSDVARMWWFGQAVSTMLNIFRKYFH